MTPLISEALGLATDMRTEIDVLITTIRPPLVSPGRLQCALFLTVAEQFESVTRLADAAFSLANPRQLPHDRRRG